MFFPPGQHNITQWGSSGHLISPVGKSKPKVDIQFPQWVGHLPRGPFRSHLARIVGGICGAWPLDIRHRTWWKLTETGAWILASQVAGAPKKKSQPVTLSIWEPKWWSCLAMGLRAQLCLIHDPEQQASLGLEPVLALSLGRETNLQPCLLLSAAPSPAQQEAWWEHLGSCYKFWITVSSTQVKSLAGSDTYIQSEDGGPIWAGNLVHRSARFRTPNKKTSRIWSLFCPLPRQVSKTVPQM